MKIPMMYRVFLLLFFIAPSIKLQAEINFPVNPSFRLVYGQVLSKGFAFFGRVGDIDRECQNWFTQNRIRRAASLTINDVKERVTGNRDAVFVCKLITSRSVDFGETNFQKEVFVKIQHRYFAFMGPINSILQECRIKLSQIGIRNLTRLYQVEFVFLSGIGYEEKRLGSQGILIGDEICGKIAFHSKRINQPNLNYYTSGSLRSNPYLFFGTKPAFFASCKKYLEDSSVNIIYRFLNLTEEIYLKQPFQDELICQAIFYAARTEFNINQTYKPIEGRLSRFNFRLSGTKRDILFSCKNFVESNNIGITRKLVIESEIIPLSQLYYGFAICGIIAMNAQTDVFGSKVQVLVGSVREIGFAIAGSARDLNVICQKQLIARRVGFVDRFRAMGQEYVLSRPLREAELCQRIISKSWVVENSVIAKNQFEISGRIQSVNYSFIGDAAQFITQCSRFFAAESSLVRIGEYSVFQNNHEVQHKINPAVFGAEACFSMILNASRPRPSSIVFTSGIVSGVAFSIVDSVGSAEIVCRNILENNDVSTASSYRLFDIPFDLNEDQISSATQICDALVQNGIQYRFDLPPKFVKPLRGTVAGIPFEFSTESMLIANDQCVEFVRERDIQLVNEIILNTESIRPAFEFWLAEEVCGVLIKNAIEVI